MVVILTPIVLMVVGIPGLYVSDDTIQLLHRDYFISHGP